MAAIDTNEEGERSNIHKELILSFTLDEEIIQFNQECERITEYPRADILHKKLSEILLPDEYLSEWKSLLHSIRETNKIDEFMLPLKTKHNTICQINWNGFFVKDQNGLIKNICLLGTSIQPIDIMQEQNDTDVLIQNYEQKARNPQVSEKQRPTPSRVPITDQQQKKKTELTRENIRDRYGLDGIAGYYQSTSSGKMEKIIENTSKQLDVMSKVIKDLSKKYDSITKRLGELEKKDKRLEKNHKTIGRHLKLLENGYSKTSVKNIKAPTVKHLPPHEQSSSEKKSSFFSDPFGYKRQQQDLDLKIHQIDYRKKELDNFEAQLLKERKTFNARVEEFCQWRDKLEQLEMEIEKRRQELMKQDFNFLKRTLLGSQGEISIEPEITEVAIAETPDYHPVLDKIPQSAAIVQRGILKQINNSFAEMIGYPLHEIVDKNFFDFVAIEGLVEVERYYLNRLKGENVTAYKTVFSTKENEKVFVEVSIKPTIYKGEKAEIAIITNLEKQEHHEPKNSISKK
jgi:PAS domain S-box-containing protein